jgi:hypothetical protein
MWQPIKTAPKDGSYLLLIDIRKRDRGNDPLPFVGMWSSLGLPSISSKWFAVPGCYGQKPTHWMPLPAPPTQEG